MFAGHLGVGLALKGRCRSVGLGVLLAAALLPDIVLWALVVVGVEKVQAPVDYRTAADFEFDFPYSHSLAATVAWSLLAGASGALCRRHRPDRWRVAFVVAAGVFSHFILDWLVHRPELPLLGPGSPQLGLGLWRHLVIAWTVEGLIAFAGVWLYLRAVKIPLARRVTLVGVMALVMAVTVWGQAQRTAPPAPTEMAWSSLVTIAFVVALGVWIDRRTDRTT